MSQVRGKTEDLAEAVVDLRRGQTTGFNEEIGQSRLPAGLCPAKKRQARKSWIRAIGDQLKPSPNHQLLKEATRK